MSQEQYDAIVEDIAMMRQVETFVANVKRPHEVAQFEEDRRLATMIVERASKAAKKCHETRQHTNALRTSTSKTTALDHHKGRRFGDMYTLKPYFGNLEHVPKTVNVVSRVVAEPIPGSTTTLPLNLHHIVARCPGAYFWPVRFCPVQIAFHAAPRTRVLIFHTGKIVGTGSRGPTSARLAIMMAIEKLAREADIHLRVKDFEIKNLVGTVQLGATVNCEGLARKYSITAHYDRSSFVGLAWRPFKKGLCCEVYSTGRMNLPGACTHAQLLSQFIQIHPILLRFSSSGDASRRALLLPPTNETVDENTNREENRFERNHARGLDTTSDYSDEDNGALDGNDRDGNDEDLWDGWGDQM